MARLPGAAEGGARVAGTWPRPRGSPGQHARLLGMVTCFWQGFFSNCGIVKYGIFDRVRLLLCSWSYRMVARSDSVALIPFDFSSDADKGHKLDGTESVTK